MAFKNKLSKIIEARLNKIIGSSTIKVFPPTRLSHWEEQGYRSITERIETEDNYSDQNQWYILKRYGHNKACFKDFITEMSVIHTSNKYTPSLFPQLLSFYDKILNKHRALLFEINGKISLEKEVAQKEKLSHYDLSEALNPILVLSEGLGQEENIKEIEEKMSRLSKGKIPKLDKLDAEKCAKKFVRNIKSLYGFRDKRRKLKKLFFSLAGRYFAKPHLESLTQTDAYPRHNYIFSLTDGGAIKLGSRLIALACTFGHPQVYDKLADKKRNIKNLLKMYVQKVNDYNAKQGRAIQNIDANELEYGFLPSAFYTNMAAAGSEARVGNLGRVKKPLETALEQLFSACSLYSEDKELKKLKKFLNLMEKRKWH